MEHLLAGRYVLQAPIGRGPVGTVWRALDRTTHEVLAVKVLDSTVLADPYVVERFQRERYTLTAFLHPSLVRVRDLVADDDAVALVMELVTGTDLRRRIAGGGRLSPVEAVEIASTVAQALAAAHAAGVVHCGLKPSNVLLDESGHVRLTDCRLARLTQATARPGADGGRGTGHPAYIAPELSGGGPSQPASDVYALGVLLTEMLTGQPSPGGAEARRGSRPRPPPDLLEPAALRPLIRACLDPEPSVRPSARELAATLHRVSSTLSPVPVGDGSRTSGERSAPLPPRGRRGGSPVSPTRPIPDHRRLPAAVVIVGLLVAAGTTAILAAWAWRGAGGRSGIPATHAPSTAGPSGGAPLTGQPITAAPPQVRPATIEGATAFVRYWFDTLTRAVGNGNTAELEATSAAECELCSRAVTAIRSAYRDGASLRGGGYVVRDVQADGFWNVAQPQLHVVFDRTPRSALNASGKLTGVLPAATFVTAQILLVRADEQWLVREVLSTTQVI